MKKKVGMSKDDALAGAANPAYSVSLNDQLKMWVDEKIPNSRDLVEVGQLVKTIESCAKLLRNFHDGESVIAADRAISRRLVLSLLPIDVPAEQLPGLPDVSELLDELGRKKVAAANYLIELNKRAKRERMGYEGYIDGVESAPFPDLTLTLLGLATKHSPTVQTLAGPVNLRRCVTGFNELPSENLHEFFARVTSVEDLADNSVVVHLTVCDGASADKYLIKPGRKCVAARVSRCYRTGLLAAQLGQDPVAIRCTIPRVPIRNIIFGVLDIDLKAIEFDQQSTRVVQLLSEQIGLDLGYILTE